MTSGKRLKQECGTVQVLSGYTLQEIKSHTHAHQWLLYIGEEEYDILEEELRNVIPEIMSLLDTKVSMSVKLTYNNVFYIKITVEGIEYTVETYLVCDLACLVELIGLYDTSHPSSNYRCPWCPIPKKLLGDFSKAYWEFRKMDEIVQKGASLEGKSDDARAAFASKNQGIKVSLQLMLVVLNYFTEQAVVAVSFDAYSAMYVACDYGASTAHDAPVMQ